MVGGTPPGVALPPPPQRATLARKGARCGAGAGSPRPHRPHPGHTGRGTPAARTRGRAAGGGTAPDTRRPSQRWQASPPGDGPPPPPRHAAPTGRAGQGDSVGTPHPQTRAHSTWVADPNSPPSGRVVGGGTAPDLRRPSQWWKAPPPGTPFRHPHSEQRRPARAHAVGRMLGPHARTDRTRDTRVAEPRLPAPEDGRPGEGKRLTPDAPHNGGRPPPPGTAPHHPRGTQPPQGVQAKGTMLGPHTHTPAPTARGWRTPTARPVGGQSGEEQRLTSDAPHNGGRHPPGDALPPPPQRATPARKGAHCGAGAGSLRPQRPRLGHTGGGDGRPGEGQRLTPDAPHNSPPPHFRATQPPRGMQAKGTVLGPHTHTPAPNVGGGSPPSGQGVGGGTAPDTRRPSQWWKAPPPGTPFRHPHSEQRRPARAHAVGPVLGPHARTDRTRDSRVAEPWLPAPEDGQAGGGTAPDTRRPSQWWKAPPPGTPFRHPHSEQRRPARAHAVGPVLGPHARTDRTRDTRVAEPRLPAPEDGRQWGRDSAHNGDTSPPPPPRPLTMQAKGTVLGPHTHTPAPTARGWRTPTARPVGGQLGEGQRHPAPQASSSAGPQGRTLWGRCWVPTPAPTAPGTHGSRNPGCPLQRTGGRGRDSA